MLNDRTPSIAGRRPCARPMAAPPSMSCRQLARRDDHGLRLRRGVLDPIDEHGSWQSAGGRDGIQ